MNLNITFTDSVNNRVIVAFDKYKFENSSFVRIIIPLNTDRVIKAIKFFPIVVCIVVRLLFDIVKCGSFLTYTNRIWLFIFLRRKA